MLLPTFYKVEIEVQRDKEIDPEFSEKFQSLDLTSISESKPLSHCTILPHYFHFLKITLQKREYFLMKHLISFFPSLLL